MGFSPMSKRKKKGGRLSKQLDLRAAAIFGLTRLPKPTVASRKIGHLRRRDSGGMISLRLAGLQVTPWLYVFV